MLGRQICLETWTVTNVNVRSLVSSLKLFLPWRNSPNTTTTNGFFGLGIKWQKMHSASFGMQGRLVRHTRYVLILQSVLE